jgi:enterochelin esterase-like enzyme
MVLRRIALVLAIVATSCLAAFAQAPAAGAPPAVKSPDLLADGRVTLRLLAPKATEVRLNGDWPDGRSVAMTKDDQGVWSVTVGPLKPELWMYSFTVDGARAIDPRNVNLARDGANYLSTFFVDGPGALPYQVADIPHGTLNIDWYPSPSLKLTRRLYVYTPPGYAAGAQRYPVLYLLHGGGGDEEAWTSMGRTPQILDYLIAQKKAKPMIVVMTNGNADQRAAQSVVPPSARAAGMSASPTVEAALAFPESVVTDVVPYIDRTYRTLADRQSRAVAGLSMGGMHTATIALRHPEAFAWVGCFSGAYPVWPGARKIVEMGTVAPTRSGPGRNERLNMDAVDKMFPTVNGKTTAFRLFYVTAGLDDFVLESGHDFLDWLKSRNIPFANVETPGYAHVWPFWRVALIDLAPRLFQQASAPR